MRQVSRTARAVICTVSVLAVSVIGARAQDSVISQDISGFSLPGVTLPQGSDEVRAADGTTCRSAVSGAGAYLDIGVIGNPNSSSGKEAAAYGRVVIPLGKKPGRLDCGRLYDLEIERLRMELRMMQMGLGIQGQPAAGGTDGMPTASVMPDEQPAMPAPVAAPAAEKDASGDSWADEGWSTEGRGG